MKRHELVAGVCEAGDDHLPMKTGGDGSTVGQIDSMAQPASAVAQISGRGDGLRQFADDRGVRN